MSSAAERQESKRKQKNLLGAGKEVVKLAATAGPVSQDPLGAVAHAPRGLKNWSSRTSAGESVRQAEKLNVDSAVAAKAVSFLPTAAPATTFSHARPTLATVASSAAAAVATMAAGTRLPQIVIASYMGAVMGIQLVADKLPRADDVAIKEEDTNDDDIKTTRPRAVFRSRFASTEAHVGSVRSLGASSTGNILVSGGQDEIIRVYDMKKLKEFGTLHRHEGTVNCMKMFSDTHLVSAGGDGKVLIWTSTNWECLSLLRGHKGEVFDLSIHPSGRACLSVGKDKTVRMWNLVSGKLAATTELKTGAQLVSWSPSGALYALAQDKTLNIYTPDGKLTQTMAHVTPILAMQWLTEGIMAVGSDQDMIKMEGGKLTLWDVTTGTQKARIGYHTVRVRHVDVWYTDDAKELPYVISAGTDGVVCLWDVSPIMTSGWNANTSVLEPVAQLKSNMRITALTVLNSRPALPKLSSSAPVIAPDATVAASKRPRAEDEASSSDSDDNYDEDAAAAAEEAEEARVLAGGDDHTSDEDNDESKEGPKDDFGDDDEESDGGEEESAAAGEAESSMQRLIAERMAKAHAARSSQPKKKGSGNGAANGKAAPTKKRKTDAAAAPVAAAPKAKKAAPAAAPAAAGAKMKAGGKAKWNKK